MQAERVNPAVTTESLDRLKDEGFILRLKGFKDVFKVQGVFWETEKPLIDKCPLATEFKAINRYKATMAAVLQERTGKPINKADFALYMPLAKVIQDNADHLGFDSKDPDFDLVTFT